MKKETRFLVHLILCCMLLTLSLPGIVTAAQELRTALVIGNSAYSSGPLKNPVNDATDMAAMLKSLGFVVTLKKEATLKQMDEAIEAFGNSLKKGGVGLFYYAGHGVQVNGTNYLLPIGAKINKETDVKYQAVDANKILDEMANANNGLNIIILDACRDNPFTRTFRSATRGLAIVSSAPSGTFISYSTSPGSVARDGKARNSPYTAALLQYMQAPELTISDVFVNVRAKVKKETGQVPWELSSLEGRFYFKPQDSRQTKLPDVPPLATKIEVASQEKMAFPLPDKPSIAVLPFLNMSEDPKQEYFSDGMTEDLITDLSKISGFMVIARNSTFTYKGKPVKVKQVAEELGVRYVLEGSVRRSGDVIRINAQLIDASTGVHLWAERYDGTMNKVFALQDEITRKIISTLQVQLTGSEKEQVGLRATDNIEAYNALLEGISHFFRYTPDGTAKAAALFKKSIELDPNYGRAYAALAHVYYQATLFTPLLPALNMSWIEARLRLREYTQMALKKPTPSAYNLSALSYLSRRQHREAIFEMERGLALDPNSRECLFNMGRVLYFAGRPKEGIEYINKSWRLDPRSRLLNLVALGWAHFCMGETAEAASFYEQALKLQPEATSTIPLAAFYAALGRDQDARSMIEMLRKKQGAVLDVGASMFGNSFMDRAIIDRYAQGLLKAGLAPGRISGGYFPASKDNQLTGEEIKSLLLGSRITGIDRDGQQWWIDREKNGEFTWRGPALKDPLTQKIISPPGVAGPYSDRGKSRIEGDMICQQFEKNYWGLEFCGTVFRNPKGTNESKDEYFFCNDIGFEPFSLVR
jgi:adenylate cyclase